MSDNFATLAGPLGTSVLFLIFLLPARADNTLPDILHATFGDSESAGYVHARASLRNIKHSVETYFKNKVFVAAINGIPAAIILTLWGALGTQVAGYRSTYLSCTRILTHFVFFFYSLPADHRWPNHQTGAPIPLVFGLITFCMDFIPSIGSAIATFLPIPTLLLSPKGSGVYRAIGGFLSLTVMQNVIGNFIEPIIYASALNVRNVACLMSLLFWGFVWGIPGMILAMPTLIFIKIIVEELAARDRRTSELKRSKVGGAVSAEDADESWSLINCISFIIAPPEFSFGVKLESLAMANAAARGSSASELKRIVDDPSIFSHNRIVLTYSAGMSGEERRATLTVTPFSSDEKRKFYKRTGEAIGLSNYFALKKHGKAPLAIAHKGRLPSSLDLAELAVAVWESWEVKEGVEPPASLITVDDHVAATMQSFLRGEFVLRIPHDEPHCIGMVRPIFSDGSDKFDLLKHELMIRLDPYEPAQIEFLRNLPSSLPRKARKHFSRCYRWNSAAKTWIHREHLGEQNWLGGECQ